MPQTGKEENAIHFNYFMGDELKCKIQRWTQKL